MKATFWSCTAFSLTLAALGSGSIAQEAPLNPAFIEAIKTATTDESLAHLIGEVSAKATAGLCTKATWTAVETGLTDLKADLAGYGLRPTINDTEDKKFVTFFAWGPSLSAAVEDLNSELSYININFWITVELKDWGTHRSIYCKYAANSGTTDLLPVAQQAFLELLPEVSETAYHDAPMRNQTPDRIQVRLFQSEDRKTTVEMRGGNSRIDVTFNRKFAEAS